MRQRITQIIDTPGPIANRWDTFIEQRSRTNRDEVCGHIYCIAFWLMVFYVLAGSMIGGYLVQTGAPLFLPVVIVTRAFHKRGR